MKTFKVSDCKIIESGTNGKVDLKEATAIAIGRENKDYNGNGKKVRALFEAIPNSDKVVCSSSYNSFVASSLIAFEKHKRLVLSPDIVWLAIVQQLAIHVGFNSEKLRKQFVNFSGKKSLLVQRNDFVKGEKNNWEDVFPDFTKQIKTFIGDNNYDAIQGSFSTTDATTKVAFEIAMMDAMKNYFDYGMSTMCGIPEITLEGTTEDWKSIVEKTKKIADYDLEWWTKDLIPILKQFVNASEDKVDREFWQSFFKLDDMSGGPYINGHILNFFPYCQNYKHEIEKRVINKNGWGGGGLTTNSFTGGLSSVPFIWLYYGQTFPMGFVSGFIGMETDRESIKPNISWAVLNRIADVNTFKIDVERFSSNLDDKEMAKAFTSAKIGSV